MTGKEIRESPGLTKQEILLEIAAQLADLNYSIRDLHMDVLKLKFYQNVPPMHYPFRPQRKEVLAPVKQSMRKR